MARKSAYATVARTRLFDTMLCTVDLVRPSCIPLWPTCQFYAGTTGFMVVITASLGLAYSRVLLHRAIVHETQSNVLGSSDVVVLFHCCLLSYE